ncbi:ubiquinone biosynthesis protein, 2-polyprenylphenol 6-hydroxylase [endosymbiont of Acanthamoeba sp. UWC8]|uniref:2-polyprenylphenol 6-hydroxylase n=1 Tax=endosymbiont of Acanthamoeba sp. UWC8 TaxID=86106 RepID=UPI0004D13984|nr:2-polyprenylphenol 6-hydroxylase [endosymbiont of Acanthamoeba sp. UWC8]AIF81765.1 ubiquinone biosynthesis protein, 2-polyprenylphenol 6-hydroxylase [endosymbiont of Acanthamoeba sp. UWC8]
MINFIANTFRLLKILLILLLSGVPYSLLRLVLLNNLSRERTIRKMGNQINNFLLRSGPSFVKLGQTLSTRPDIIGESLSNSLSKLQDKVPPFNFTSVERTLEKEFKTSLDNLFKEFDKTPVAAASIAQVHKAVTFDNEPVAVKILRPNIEKKFNNDLKLFYFITEFLLFFFPPIKSFKLDQVVKTLEHSVSIETDLRIEGAAADQLRENFANDDSVYIPQMRWDLTSKRVLTQEWIDGIPINERQKLIKAGHNLQQIAKNLAITFFNQAYRDGFFHADIHPGNVMINNAGKIVLIDFGIMGSLEKEDRVFVAKILYGFITRDYKAVSDIHFEMGYVPHTQSREIFALACRSVGEPIVGMPVNKISIGKLLKQLFEISKKFDMNIQPKFLLLQKTLVTVEGTGQSLYPEVNMWQLAEPWIKDWARQNFGIKARIKDTKANIIKLSHDLPKAVDKMLSFFDKMEKNVDTQGFKINNRPEPKAMPFSSLKIIAIFIVGMSIGLMF